MLQPILTSQQIQQIAANPDPALYRKLREFNLQQARTDPRAFMRRVLRDERTGKPIVDGYPRLHDEWQEMLSNHQRVVVWSHPEAAKTSQISIGRVLYELGKNLNLRIAVISNTLAQAEKIIRTIGQYIEKSEDLHDVFPHLHKAKDPSIPWNSTILTVERPIIARDPSVQACGVHGNITGSRVDVLILDDILDYENTRTRAQMDDVWQWLQSTPMGRLTEDARVWCIGNAWHPSDAMHRLEKLPRYVARRFPVASETGELSWPKRWSAARIETAREDLGPHEANRQLFCMARDDADARFKREWIDRCLALGNGHQLVDSVTPEEVEGGAIFHGVDLGVQLHAHADKCAFVTILLHPDHTRQILSILVGRWSGPEIIERISELDRRFGGTFIVENNAAQDYILQFAKQLSAAVVRPFTTGRQKAHPEFGVEGIGAELAAGRWIIPNDNGRVQPPIAALISSMLYYDPAEHTGDDLMAMWFAREGARTHERKLGREEEGDVSVRVIG